MDTLKEKRALASFYGAPALRGTKKQKEWAETIRRRVFESDELREEQKIELAAAGGRLLSAKFWIENRGAKPSAFVVQNILAELIKLELLYSKHYQTLTRTGVAAVKAEARAEIRAALEANALTYRFEFPNCDFYDRNGRLR